MVENVIEISADLQLLGLTKFEEFVNTQVYTPGTRPYKKVTLGHSRIIKEVCARWRQSERSRIEELIAG